MALIDLKTFMEFKEPSLLEVLLDVLVRNTIARTVYKRYVDGLKLKGDERVLDFGGGSGIASGYVAQAPTMLFRFISYCTTSKKLPEGPR